MTTLREFLTKNGIVPCSELPLVHTTQAYNFTGITENLQITPRECNVFEGENLNYFFYGKPSYKVKQDEREAEDWQLPVCFVVKMNAVGKFKRIFPFDSGAFCNKRHPDYISMMPIEKFDVGNDYTAPSKIVGAFFANISDYFRLKPRDRENLAEKFLLNTRDAEIFALQTLAQDRNIDQIDDRRFCIELSTDEVINLDQSNTLCVIIPIIYLDDEYVREFIIDKLKAIPINYDPISTNASTMTAVVYQKILDYYREQGIV